MRLPTATRLPYMCLALSVLLFCTAGEPPTVAVSPAKEGLGPDTPASHTPTKPPAHGREVVTIRNRAGQEVGLYTASYALVIGVSAYTDWPPLPEVPQDIQEIATVLQEQGFHVETVPDPPRDALLRTFDSFIA